MVANISSIEHFKGPPVSQNHFSWVNHVMVRMFSFIGNVKNYGTGSHNYKDSRKGLDMMLD